MITVQTDRQPFQFVGFYFNLVKRNEKLSRVTKSNNNQYVYTGLQLVHPKVFANIKKKIFSFTEIFDCAIQNKTLYGLARLAHASLV